MRVALPGNAPARAAGRRAACSAPTGNSDGDEFQDQHEPPRENTASADLR
jgi:hypothetical protein